MKRLLSRGSSAKASRLEEVPCLLEDTSMYTFASSALMGESREGLRHLQKNAAAKQAFGEFLEKECPGGSFWVYPENVKSFFSAHVKNPELVEKEAGKQFTNYPGRGKSRKAQRIVPLIAPLKTLVAALEEFNKAQALAFELQAWTVYPSFLRSRMFDLVPTRMQSGTAKSLADLSKRSKEWLDVQTKHRERLGDPADPVPVLAWLQRFSEVAEVLGGKDPTGKGAGWALCVSDPTVKGCPLVFANSRFLSSTGYTLQEVLGRNLSFLLGADTDPEACGMVESEEKRKAAFRIKLLTYRKNGQKFWSLWCSSPVVDGSGQAPRLVVTVHVDLSVRRHGLDLKFLDTIMSHLPKRAALVSGGAAGEKPPSTAGAGTAATGDGGGAAGGSGTPKPPLVSVTESPLPSPPSLTRALPAGEAEQKKKGEEAKAAAAAAEDDDDAAYASASMAAVADVAEMFATVTAKEEKAERRTEAAKGAEGKAGDDDAPPPPPPVAAAAADPRPTFLTMEQLDRLYADGFDPVEMVDQGDVVKADEVVGDAAEVAAARKAASDRNRTIILDAVARAITARVEHDVEQQLAAMINQQENIRHEQIAAESVAKRAVELAAASPAAPPPPPATSWALPSGGGGVVAPAAAAAAAAAPGTGGGTAEETRAKVATIAAQLFATDPDREKKIAVMVEAFCAKQQGGAGS